MRTIAIMTGSRAEYGQLRPLMHKVQEDPELTLCLLVCGTHLAPEFGYTYREIEADGFVIDAKIEMLLSGDTATVISKSMGVGLIGFSDALDRLAPDILVVLGDRFETLTAAIAATIARIPIAHLHGGEATEGLIDEPIRHSITKMAHLHFTSTEEYRRRVIQLGELPDNVHTVGAMSLDSIRTTTLLDRATLENVLQFELGQPTFLVTFHPVTLEKRSAAAQGRALLAALDAFPNARIIITLPNADTDNAELRAQLTEYAACNNDRVAVFSALGTERYFSVLAQCDVVVGNSSSGLLEAPSFSVPTVNIGDRQRGRFAPRSVIHCTSETEEIARAIRAALDPGFKSSLHSMEKPYGDGQTAPRIVDVLRQAPLDENLLKKRFFDLPLGYGVTQ